MENYVVKLKKLKNLFDNQVATFEKLNGKTGGKTEKFTGKLGGKIEKIEKFSGYLVVKI